ncbi:TonB-dependent receptor [Saccharicrinis sp. FJH62]|uniref:TonB-dependent receptor n=1 Tax=Saccharicrinis sp. FJH62 TaxID=3344657 RepID=UPI0035D41D67
MKNLLAMAILLLTSVVVYGQTSVFNGKVVDQSGEPVLGAAVQIENSRLGTVADEKGEFSLKLSEPGTYTYLVSFVGYEKVTGTVTLKEGDNPRVMITMTSSLVTMDELLVTAIKAGNSSPFAHSNVDQQELEEKNVAADMPTLLQMLPSVVSTSENGTGFGYSSFRIRGTDISRINVTVNGVPLNDSESQGVFWVNMPDFASSVQNIQVQRGVGTSTNGAAAFGASVNFTTLGVEPKPYFEYQGMGGSFNTFKNTVMAGTGLLKNGFNVDVRFSKLNSDGYIERGFTDHQSFFASAGWRNDKTLLKAIVLIGEEHTGITWWGVPSDSLATNRRFNPAGEYVDDAGNIQYYDGQTDNYWQNHYQLMGNHAFSEKLSLNAAVHLTTGKGYYQQYQAGEDLADYGFSELSSSTDLIRQKWLDNSFYGANASLIYQGKKSRMTFGSAYTNYDGDHYGLIKWLRDGDQDVNMEWYRNTGLKKDFNVFAKAEYQLLENFWVFEDLQLRNIKYDMEGPDDDLVLVDQSHNWTFFNPKFGLSYKLNDIRFYGSFATANREPARADLKDATKAGGNDIPTPERLYDTEAGAVWSSEKAAANVNLYYMNYKDQLVNTGELNSVGYPIMTNVDKSYRLGVELGWKIQPVKQLSWEANATLSRNKIIDYVEYAEAYDADWNEFIQTRQLGNTDISYSPSVIAGSDLTINAGQKIALHLINKYVGKQYFDNTMSEDRAIDAYHFMNVRLDVGTFDVWKMKLSAQFLVNNVYDAMYSNNAYGGNWYEQGTEYTWKYYFPQAGRNYAAKLVLRF